MKNRLAATIVVLAAVLMIPSSVNAGASASAPSKYAQTGHANQQRADQKSYPITEYSSSVRRHKPTH